MISDTFRLRNATTLAHVGTYGVLKEKHPTICPKCKPYCLGKVEGDPVFTLKRSYNIKYNRFYWYPSIAPLWAGITEQERDRNLRIYKANNCHLKLTDIMSYEECIELPETKQYTILGLDKWND